VAFGVDVARSAGPSFDCSHVTAGSIEEVVCRNPTLSLLDAETARLDALASKAPAAGADVLKDEQRQWLGDRAKCTTAPEPETCARDRYIERIDWLRLSQRATRGADAKGISLGPFAYRCDQTDPPLAYVSRKSIHVVLAALPSGSGARYGVEGGPSLWIHGKGEALYREGARRPEVRCKEEPLG
jgi:uncharacterized protein